MNVVSEEAVRWTALWTWAAAGLVQQGFFWRGRSLGTRRDKLLDEINVNLADPLRKEVRQYVW